MAIKDETPTIEIVEDQVELEALQREQSRRSNFRFSNVGIPFGATLSFVKDETLTAVVVDDRTIEFEGTMTSTSNAAKILLHRMGGTLSAAQGPLYWMYDGETLAERFMRLESDEDQSLAKASLFHCTDVGWQGNELPYRQIPPSAHSAVVRVL